LLIAVGPAKFQLGTNDAANFFVDGFFGDFAGLHGWKKLFTVQKFARGHF